ncbi:hypothetical protein VPH35_116180 [Triticum aestivum]|uniref:Uncharacterized protein n=1 Tax=Aegilops tauschii TaxID=37682 RepID=R7WGB3_AEGTA
MGSMDDSRMYKRQKRKEKHLYLVLDEWDKGFTIRKIDADSPDDHSRSLLDEPPVIRLLSPNPIHRMDFAALGSSHILAASNKHPATLVYDTDTAGLITGPPVPDALQDAYTILLPAGDDTLYAFAYYLDESQAVESVRTLSFDTGRSEWTPHGDWVLPFMDRGHFDSYLDAWVGLHEDGYIGACQVASPTPAADMKMPPLDWKMASEKLWSKGKEVEMPTLTCMGGARFCLVGCVGGKAFHLESRINLSEFENSERFILDSRWKALPRCKVFRNCSFPEGVCLSIRSMLQGQRKQRFLVLLHALSTHEELMGDKRQPYIAVNFSFRAD